MRIHPQWLGLASWVCLLLAGFGWLRGADAESANGGVLTGRLVYDGEPPEPVALDVPEARGTLNGELVVSEELTHYRSLGLTNQTLLVSQSGGLQNAIIWLSDKRAPIPPVPPVGENSKPVTLMLKNGKFEPQVLAWWGPARMLELVNEDKYALNLRSDPGDSAPFNRLLPPAKSVKFAVSAQKRPALVQSDVQHWLPPAVLFPCAHPYFAVSDAEGRFTLRNLPPGEWEFTTWHQRSGWLRTTAWPKGRFTQKIGAEVIDLGEVKLPTELFEVKK